MNASGHANAPAPSTPSLNKASAFLACAAITLGVMGIFHILMRGRGHDADTAIVTIWGSLGTGVLSLLIQRNKLAWSALVVAILAVANYALLGM